MERSVIYSALGNPLETGFAPAPRPGPGLSSDSGLGCAGGGDMRAWAWFFPNVRENSKYPKGPPFFFIFLYLNTSNFHSISNVSLNILAIFNLL